MRPKGSILVFGHPHSDLVSERVVAGSQGGYRPFWFVFQGIPDEYRDMPGLAGFVAPPVLRRGGRTVTRASMVASWMRLQPCITHVHYALMQPEYYPWVARLQPLVVSVMGGDITPGEGFRGVDARSARSLLGHATIITSKSRHMDRLVLDIGPYGHKIRRVTWGVDLERFRPRDDAVSVRARFGLPLDQVLLFSARACHERLMHETVVSAFARARQDFAQPVTLLVSEYNASPEYLERIKALVADRGLHDAVRFMPSLSAGEMADVLAASDAVLSVPRNDGMPQTVYQAMAAGTPVVLTDLPATEELLDAGCHARLVPVGDVDGLSRVMARIVADLQGERKRASGNRRLVATLADRRAQVARMNCIYDELLPQTLGRRLSAAPAMLGRGRNRIGNGAPSRAKGGR